MAILRTLEDETAPRRTVAATTPTVTGAASPVAPVTTPAPAMTTPAPSLAAPAVTAPSVQPATAQPSSPTTYDKQYLEGFDFGKLDDPAHASIKYQFARVASKYPPTQQGFSQLLADPEFQKLGAQSLGNGVIKLSDGTQVDVIRGYQQGGYAWQWGVSGAGATPTQTGTAAQTVTNGQWVYNGTTGQYEWYVPGSGTTATGSYNIPGSTADWGYTSEFTDPTTANFENVINSRIEELLAPVPAEARQQYADLLQQYVTGLSTADPSLQDLIGSLQNLASYAGQPSQAETLAGGLASQYQTLDPAYQAAARARIAELQADPYTGAEWEAYRTAALDPIEADRQAAIQRVLGQVANQGMDLDSGVAQALLGEVNRGYDANRATAQNQLALSRVAQRQDRRGQAFDIETALAEALQNRQMAGLGLARQGTEDALARLGLQAQTYGTLADILPARSQQQLQAAQQLSGLETATRQEEEARRQSAIALQGLLAELPERRLQLALATLGQGEAPDSMVNSLLQLAGLSNQSSALANQQSAQTWSGLGSLLGYLSNYTGGSGTSAADLLKAAGYTTFTD